MWPRATVIFRLVLTKFWPRFLELTHIMASPPKLHVSAPLGTQFSLQISLHSTRLLRIILFPFPGFFFYGGPCGDCAVGPGNLPCGTLKQVQLSSASEAAAAPLPVGKYWMLEEEHLITTVTGSDTDDITEGTKNACCSATPSTGTTARKCHASHVIFQSPTDLTLKTLLTISWL